MLSCGPGESLRSPTPSLVCKSGGWTTNPEPPAPHPTESGWSLAKPVLVHSSLLWGSLSPAQARPSQLPRPMIRQYTSQLLATGLQTSTVSSSPLPQASCAWSYWPPPLTMPSPALPFLFPRASDEPQELSLSSSNLAPAPPAFGLPPTLVLALLPARFPKDLS